MVLALIVSAGQAQQSLEGIVKDADTQMPLEQVSVYLPQLEKGTVTDASGKFLIRNLPAGTYKLVASFIGYTTYSASIPVGSTSTPMEINLHPSVIEMEEVIVSTPFHKLQRENVMKVEQASLAELKARGSMTLADGIYQDPGSGKCVHGPGDRQTGDQGPEL